jgi:hypothetical protein
MSDDDSVSRLLRDTAPNAYCLHCLAQAFPLTADLRNRIEEAIVRGDPLEALQGRCAICGDQRSVVRHRAP